MPRHTLQVRSEAPIDVVFELWIDLDRMKEWVRGVTEVTDVTGPMTQAGTRYITHFGPVKSPSEVLEVDPPRRIRTRFGSWILRGENTATFRTDGNGTWIDQEIQTRGLMSEISSRIFALGSYKGSYQGELTDFARLAEQEAARRTGGEPPA